MNLTQKAIAIVQAAGFDVYMRESDDTFLMYTDGTRIAYLECDKYERYSVSSRHKPSTSHGTGFGIADRVSENQLTAEMLESALVAFAPSWARDIENIRKWRDMAEFLAADSFNAKYKLVTRGETNHAND